MNRYPQFIIIGAMKCATSTLHEQLALQPGIVMSEPKEPFFFSNDEVYAKGLNWYASLFADAKPGDLCGESSTHYSKLPTYPQTVERMKAALPRVKLIYVMRHPIDRLQSQFIHEWTERKVGRDIRQAIESFPALVDYSRYAMQLRPYFDAYGPENVLPVFFEHMVTHPQAELERVCRFIGYQGKPTWNHALGEQNVSAQRLRTSGWRDALVYAPGVSQIRAHLVPQSVRDRIKRLWTMPSRPEIPEHQVEWLRTIFDEELAELGRWLGVELTCETWKDVVRPAALEWTAAVHRRARRRMGGVGVVVIGRNEGERLRVCLRSLEGKADTIVYVDSGSADGSAQLAASMGVRVVDLDLSRPFTAARARNAGLRELLRAQPDTAYVQFVDGDCEVVEGWIQTAKGVLDADPKVAVVCGRRRERFPEASIYNRLCDIEWDTPVGDAAACGGDALMRVDAVKSVGAYDPTVIAAEDDDLCVRLRHRGWSIRRIDAEMTIHDAAMTSVRQWWKRAARSGHAFAQVRQKHRGSGIEHFAREYRSVLVWGAGVPAATAVAAALSGGLGLVLLAGYPYLAWRVARHVRRRGYPSGQAWLYGAHCATAKFPQLAGVMAYWRRRLANRPATIIEYKGASPAARA